MGYVSFREGNSFWLWKQDADSKASDLLKPPSQQIQQKSISYKPESSKGLKSPRTDTVQGSRNILSQKLRSFKPPKTLKKHMFFWGQEKQPNNHHYHHLDRFWC